MAVLSYLDFFSTGVQLPSDAADFVMEAVPHLTKGLVRLLATCASGSTVGAKTLLLLDTLTVFPELKSVGVSKESSKEPLSADETDLSLTPHDSFDDLSDQEWMIYESNPDFVFCESDSELSPRLNCSCKCSKLESSEVNISMNWKFLDSANISSRFPDFQRSDGNSVIELMSTPTKITGVHYVQVENEANELNGQEALQIQDMED